MERTYDSLQELLKHRCQLEEEDIREIKSVFNQENLSFVSAFFGEHLAAEHLSSYAWNQKKHIRWERIRDEKENIEWLLMQHTATGQSFIARLSGEGNQFHVLFEQNERRLPEVDEYFEEQADELHPFLYFVHGHKGRYWFFDRIEKGMVIIDLERTCVQKAHLPFDYPLIKCSRLYPGEQDITLTFPLYEGFHFKSLMADFLSIHACIPMYFLFSDRCYDSYALPASGDGRMYLFHIEDGSFIPIHIPVSDEVIRHSHELLGISKNRDELIIGAECWLGGEKQSLLIARMHVGKQKIQVLHGFSWSEARFCTLWSDRAVSPDGTKILICVNRTATGSNVRLSELYVMALSDGEILQVRAITEEEKEEFQRSNNHADHTNDICWIDDHTIKYYHEWIHL